MLDIHRISTIDIKTLSEEETDSWCQKILKYPLKNEYESLDRSDLIELFEFTRSLLNVKHIQTDVLLEELQNVEQKYEDIQNDFDLYKQRSQESELETIRKELQDREQHLKELEQQQKVLNIELEQKDKQLVKLKAQLNNVNNINQQTLSSTDSGLDSENRLSSEWESNKNRLKEKNEQIEQLLDKLYDCDRINLNLAEQLAKIRVDLAKMDNERQLLEARSQMLTKQIQELEMLNENLMHDRRQKDDELNRLRKDLEGRATINGLNKSNSSEEENNDDQINYSQIINKEVDRLNALLVVKNQEIQELREVVKNQFQPMNDDSMDKLNEQREQIERFEEELSILSESLNKSSPSDDEHSNQMERVQHRKLYRKIRKQNKQIEHLQLRLQELDLETKRKDEQLIKQRKRMSMLIGGDDRVRKLFEENSILSRMVRNRDNRIEFLVNQLNKHTLNDGTVMFDAVADGGSISGTPTGSSLCLQKEIEIHDQMTALAVERDMLQRQMDAVKIHMESVHNENLELQMAMKEILDAIRQSDVNSDLVLECPSLERLCRLLENRSIFSGTTTPINTTQPLDGGNVDITQIILLKSELDHVRGQNDQLRNELKHLRADFLSVIDEYTTDILDNWTMSNTDADNNHRQQNNYSSGSEDFTSKTEDEDDNDEKQLKHSSLELKSVEEKQDFVSLNSLTKEKLTEGSRARLRSRIQRRRQRSKQISNVKKQQKFSMNRQDPRFESIVNNKIEMTDASTDPMENWPSVDKTSVEDKSIMNKLIETRSTQTSFEQESNLTTFNEETIRNKPIDNVEQSQSKPELDRLDENESSYVLMCDESVQAVPIIQCRSSQTDQVEVYVKQEIKKCDQCSKYVQMLDSVRKLIEKERQHFRIQEAKQTETIDQLRQSLSFVQQEYKLDIEAKNDEISNLRAKMAKLTTNSIQQTKPEQKLISVETIENIIGQNEDYGQVFSKQVNFVKNIQPNEQQCRQQTQQNKIILETIVECLQKCLKQKDEALDEYRFMLEQMRKNYSMKTVNEKRDNHPEEQLEFDAEQLQPVSAKNVLKTSCDYDANSTNLIQMEKIYEDLFIKPQVQENDQLMELLRSTLHQLESVRTKSRERIKQMEIELEKKSALLMELDANHRTVSKQLTDSKEQIRQLKTEMNDKNNQIQTLTQKLNNMIRRNQQSVQTTSALKKKVQVNVLQESEDLRSQIVELNAQVRRLEVDKWNIEKRLSQERQSAKERLAERDEQLTQMHEQMNKLQTLIAKMEKKTLKSNNQNKTTTNTATKYTQTTLSMVKNQKKKLNGHQSSQSEERIHQPPIVIIREEKSTEKTKSEKISPSELDDANQMQPKQNEDEQMKVEELENDPFLPEMSDDSSRQIIIDTLRRKQMSAMMNEISVVANEMLKSSKENLKNNRNDRKTAIPHQHEQHCDDQPRQHHSLSSMTNDDDCASSIVCADCETKFNAHRIEQHLIDLRLERLLDENIKLKLQLQHQNSSNTRSQRRTGR